MAGSRCKFKEEWHKTELIVSEHQMLALEIFYVRTRRRNVPDFIHHLEYFNNENGIFFLFWNTLKKVVWFILNQNFYKPNPNIEWKNYFDIWFQLNGNHLCTIQFCFWNPNILLNCIDARESMQKIHHQKTQKTIWKQWKIIDIHKKFPYIRNNKTFYCNIISNMCFLHFVEQE